MAKREIKKITIILFALVFVFGIFSFNVNANEKNIDKMTDKPVDNVFVQMNGETVDLVSMGIDEKLTLTAHTTIDGDVEYKWEILIDASKNQWVSIYDCTDVNITISYGMLSNFLDENNLSQIRAVVMSGEDVYISDRVLVEVKQEEIIDDNVAFYGALLNYGVNSIADTTNDEASDTVTLTINYIKSTGEQVCDPYVATIFKGMHFKTTVLSPTVAGYEPKLNEDDVDLVEEYVFDYDSVNEDVIINIYYFPIEVKYEVRYYFQGIYDDEYTMTGTPIVAYGEVGTAPDEKLIGAEFEGFTRVNYQPELIASDGSTVFQCFYDREYYLIDLDLDGGHGVDSIYAKYGTAFIVNKPKKAGWIFNGWDLNDDGIADEIPSTIPSENLSLKALWDITETTYTVVYWLENADSSEYDYVGSKVENAQSSDIVSGKDDIADSIICGNKEHTHSSDCSVDSSYYEFVKADADIVINGDGSSIVNVYYTRKKYTLRFYYARSQGDKVEVVGGSTYGFGALNGSTTENTPVQTLLENVTAWGEVENVPTVNEQYRDRYTIDEITYGDYTYHYLEFTGKFGSDIGNLWAIGVFDPVKIVGTHSQCDYEYAYFSAWNGEYRVKYTQDHKSMYGGNETIKGCYMYLDENIIFDKSFTDSSLISFLGFWDNGADVSWSIPELYTYNLMVESLVRTDEKGYELYKSFDTYDDSSVSNQTATNIKGMTYTGYDYVTISDGSDGSMEEYSINFYYDRNEYDLSFYNYSTLISEKTVLYGDTLNQLYFEPDYPLTLEENAYEFDGWYTTAECYEDSEFIFEEATMPSNDLVLYAKWIPVTHTVTFYNTYQDMVNGNAALNSVQVSHGEVVESNDVPEVENAGYTAGEWFYTKNGEKVAYKPMSIAVKDDLNVYKDWSSSTVVEYTVHYYKKGTTEKIADSSHGWMFDGATKTFKAKGGGELGELYEEYNDGWYPMVSSTSIVANKDGDNTVIFYYDYQNPNPYIVKYVDSDTGLEIADRKVVSDNKKSVVVEVYKPITNYMPDAYYKQLVLAYNKEGSADYDSEKNVITFYYSKSSDSAYYAVEYYFMNVDGISYKLNAKIQSPITIGSTANIPEVSTDGFSFEKCLVRDGNETEFREVSEYEINNVEVSESGALIQIYYKRQKTSYTVHYYISGTETSLKDDKTVGDIYFGTSITEDAGDDVEGYSLAGEKSQTKELVLNPAYNVFTFYYEEKTKTAKYIPVCNDEEFSDIDFGFVSQTQDLKKWSEEYDEVTANAKDGFYFVGWYSDKELTNFVTTDATVRPDSNEDITYYALFEPYYTDLTVSKSVDIESENQTFLFHVTGIEEINDHIDITVTVHGAGEVKVCHLPLGKYKITEDTNWSWKYSAVGEIEREIDLVLDADVNTAEFTNNLGASNWLNGENYSVNIFSGKRLLNFN